MFTFALSTDLHLVKLIVTHPAVYRHLCDDNSPAPGNFIPPQGDLCRYLIVAWNSVVMGLWAFLGGDPCGPWEIHTAMLPEAYGKTRAASREMLGWVWENTKCAEITTKVPENNRLALALARAAGMREYGIEEKSFLRDGVMLDQILLKINRPEVF